jgi:LCP family protein required for cell wall assembly
MSAHHDGEPGNDQDAVPGADGPHGRPDSGEPAGGLSAGRERRAAGRGSGRRRKAVIRSLAIVCTLMLGFGSVAYFAVNHIVGNIKTAPILPSGVAPIPEKPDPFGRTALNILVIGSDTRDNPTDCRLGGLCGPGANGDVEMIMHLSADRTNATVISIPRDTWTALPSCAQAAEDGINSALQSGPSCQVAAAMKISGMPIDHFILVDFAGVIAMSNALGGVPVCVQDNVYDTHSGLRLTAGPHLVQGLQALQFLRTRYAFFDGSDNIGRSQATHIFLSSMIRELRSRLNLSDLGTLYSVFDAASKALTVDPALAGVTGLTNLATDLNKIPTNRITFLTMPNYVRPGDAQHVLEDVAQAQPLFDAIKNDQPYTPNAGATAGPSPSAGQTSSGPSVDKAAVPVSVGNATGAGLRAGELKSALSGSGFTAGLIDTFDAQVAKTTGVYYPPNRAESAAAVAGALGIPAVLVHQSNAYDRVTVIVGTDWTSGTSFPAAPGAPVTAVSAPADSYELNAGSAIQCIPVQPADRF